MNYTSALLFVSLFTMVLTFPCDELLLQDSPGLQNVIRVTPKLLSGSSPEGETGFRTLQMMGVKTIITVDGAKPDLVHARKFGLRYVHLPIGYDGVPVDQGLRIAKAVKELPGLIYMHCHHGKHRSPAAAAVVKLHLDENCSNANALALMKTAGTDPKYLGLYAVARDYQRIAIDWSKISSDFPEVASTGTLVMQMVKMDEHWDRLNLSQQSSWQSPQGHPDIDPSHEALMLKEHYVELRRQPGMQTKPAPFQTMLQEAETSARLLEEALRSAPRETLLPMINKHFRNSQSSCTKCHALYRDVPQAK